jgi:ubiquinone/menaquinone biosynthesis C-methylase UbiE
MLQTTLGPKPDSSEGANRSGTFGMPSVPRLPPRAKKLLWRGTYEVISMRGRTPPFMNYGYAPLDEELTGDSAIETEVRGRLYLATAGAVDLTDKDVLEVGSGRGGGAALVFERLKPRSLTGLDPAHRAVRCCRAQHSRPGLDFLVGDAEALPFADGSFDAVLNVESCHCYPNIPQFLHESRRVLRPGGHLLLADFRTVSPVPGSGQKRGAQQDVAAFRRQLSESGMRIVEEEDIARNVSRALELMTPSIRARVERTVPRPLRRLALEFQGIEGSDVHRVFATGESAYVRFVLERD